MLRTFETALTSYTAGIRLTTMAGETILVVDDEEDILELLEYNFTREGYTVLRARRGEEAVAACVSHRPDLVILDLMLPGLSGLDVCKQLKSDPKTACTPIVMLTARGEEADVVVGLEMGADDYVTKPFSPRVLIARVRTVLRRGEKTETDDDTPLSVHGIEIQPGRREVRVNGTPVRLTFTEFGVLHYLARRPGWVFTRYQIVEAVRGDDYAVTDRAVDVQIAGLRKKLGSHGHLIETVRGVGYRFKE